MNISTLTKKEKKKKKNHIHTQKYMNYYNFFVLIKRKRKNRIIKDIVKTKNVERRIIKWEREIIFATTVSQTKKSKIVATAKPMRA